jgi:hypothetical protein
MVSLWLENNVYIVNSIILSLLILTGQMLLLDALDNLPRLRVSDSLMKVFLYILRECGVKNVPSHYKFQKKQDEL